MKIFGGNLGIPYGGIAHYGLVEIYTVFGENGLVVGMVRLQLLQRGASVAGHSPLRSSSRVSSLPLGSSARYGHRVCSVRIIEAIVSS